RVVNDDPAPECRFLVTAGSGDPHERSVSLFSVERSERVGSAIPAVRVFPYARHAAIPQDTATKADPAESTTAHTTPDVTAMYSWIPATAAYVAASPRQVLPAHIRHLRRFGRWP